MIEPQPNPDTVEALLDTTWRLAVAETARTDALDRKAATVASFASLVAALTATVGLGFVDEFGSWWAFGLFVAGLAALLGSVGCATRALWPREYLTLGIAYLSRFPTWQEIRKPPEQVRGETMRTLVEAIARERSTSDKKLSSLRWSFRLLLLGLVVVAVEGATLALEEVRR